MKCHFHSGLDDSRSSTPKSDSEISNQNKDNPEMLWTWGELPQAAQVKETIQHLGQFDNRSTQQHNVSFLPACSRPS